MGYFNLSKSANVILCEILFHNLYITKYQNFEPRNQFHFIPFPKKIIFNGLAEMSSSFIKQNQKLSPRKKIIWNELEFQKKSTNPIFENCACNTKFNI